MPRNALISGCMKVEKSAAAAYRKLMTKFPDKIDFWNELFNDEIDHLAFLKDTKSLGLIDIMQRIDPLPSKTIINKAVKIADDLSAKIVSGSISFKKALVMALKLEESMVETYTNRLIANLISCEDEKSYKKIVADEKKHINKIKNMMSK